MTHEDEDGFRWVLVEHLEDGTTRDIDYFWTEEEADEWAEIYADSPQPWATYTTERRPAK